MPPVWTATITEPPHPRSGPQLAGDLLDLDHDELSRFERRESDDDVDDAQIDVVLGGCGGIATYEIGLGRRGALERALPEQVLHEGADVQPDLRPERFIVRFEDDPLSTLIEAGLEEQRQAPD